MTADPQAATTYWRGAAQGLKGIARARALWSLAQSLVESSQSADALRVLDEAERLTADKRATGTDLARIYATRGAALMEVGRRDDAEASLGRAMSYWDKAGPTDESEKAETLMSLATAALDRGQIDRAKQLGERAVAAFPVGRELGSPHVAMLANLSTIYLQARELEPAERYARQAVQSAGALPEDHPIALIALNNWVAVLAAQNRREESVDILGRIARIREKKYGPDYAPLAITYNNLARNLMFLGRSADGEPYSRKAVAIGEKTRAKDDQSLAAFRDNLADLLDEQGKFAEAATIRRTALADLGNANENRAMRIRRSLAVTLVKQGDRAAALPEFERVAAWLGRTRPPDNPEVIDVQASIAVLEAAAGRPGAAERMRATLALVERSLFTGGDASRRITSLGPTLTSLLEAAWRTGDRATGFRIAQLIAWGDAGRAAAAAAQREGAGPNAAIIRRRQDLLEQRDRHAEAALRAFGKNPGEYQAANAELTRTDAALTQVERELAQALPAFAALAQFTPLTEAEVMRKLTPKQALVMPIPLGQGAITFVLRGAGAEWAISPEGRDLPAAVATLRNGLAGDAKFDAAPAHTLYRALIPARLDQRLAGADTWLLAPAGAFSAVPFAALVTDARPGPRPAWLIRQVALATVPGLGELNRATATAASDRFVGIGAPALTGAQPVRSLRGLSRGGTARTAALSTLAPLPAAERELTRMAAALPDYRATMLTGAAATETAVKATDFRGAGVLAFATHGLVGGAVEPGSEPGLVLTPPATPGTADDGLLTASEIAQLDLPVDWVVLSACDTAAGVNPGAPALSGLARAFLYAGARSLLVSHWAVRDDVAARLTVDTVRRARAGASRPQALRQAMLALIDDPRVAGAADPAVWAPFILVQR